MTPRKQRRTSPFPLFPAQGGKNLRLLTGRINNSITIRQLHLRSQYNQLRNQLSTTYNTFVTYNRLVVQYIPLLVLLLVVLVLVLTIRQWFNTQYYQYYYQQYLYQYLQYVTLLYRKIIHVKSNGYYSNIIISLQVGMSGVEDRDKNRVGFVQRMVTK